MLILSLNNLTNLETPTNDNDGLLTDGVFKILRRL